MTRHSADRSARAGHRERTRSGTATTGGRPPREATQPPGRPHARHPSRLSRSSPRVGGCTTAVPARALWHVDLGVRAAAGDPPASAQTPDQPALPRRADRPARTMRVFARPTSFCVSERDRNRIEAKRSDTRGGSAPSVSSSGAVRRFVPAGLVSSRAGWRGQRKRQLASVEDGSGDDERSHGGAEGSACGLLVDFGDPAACRFASRPARPRRRAGTADARPWRRRSRPPARRHGRARSRRRRSTAPAFGRRRMPDAGSLRIENFARRLGIIAGDDERVPVDLERDDSAADAHDARHLLHDARRSGHVEERSLDASRRELSVAERKRVRIGRDELGAHVRRRTLSRDREQLLAQVDTDRAP